MEFRILGPFEVLDERGPVALGGTKPRAVLAALVMHPNEPVSAERLALALWGEDAPEGAIKTLQVHVSRLRKALGDVDVLATTPAGYQLRVRAGELDSERFEQLVGEGRNLLASEQPEEAAAVLREALTLWRGSPFAELAFEPFAQAEIARLEEERLAALEARVEADLAAGREAALIGELQHLVAEHPTRERLAGQLMLALYRCGRQADALKAYSDVRQRLVSDIGVEPGPELRRLQEAILHQDASLEPDIVAGVELPPELDAATALALEGRGEELDWLRGRWEQARVGAGSLVTVIGERGIGKTRLLAELAGEVHAGRALVVYAAGAGPADPVLATVRRAGGATRPTLLVIDDADRADPDVLAALDDLARAVADVPVLAVVAGRDGELLAGLGAEGSLLLRTLPVESVSAIAAGYAPDHAPEEVPADWLLEASAGVPLRVHELAGQWARREAARRVGVAAGRAAEGRAELRSREAEVRGGVVDLQTAREHVALLTEHDEPVVCPFKGLASFDVSDAPYFFGREELVAELVARLAGAPLLGVIGPSGSGKSSALRAGLLPALAGGVLPASEQRTQVLIRPGKHPMQELRSAVTGLRDERMVIAVDQFEETFTTCREEDERAEFIAALVRAARDPGHQSLVVLAVRADYYGRCAAYPDLSSVLAPNHVLVRPMQPDELRRAIELPARRAGLRVDPELTDALVADTKDEPGALPLLSTSLLELWQHRRGRRLRHADYEHTGGVRGAVARLAEGAYDRLDEDQRHVARAIFLRLATEGEEGAVERRRVPLAELETGGNGDVPSVVSSLADERLLTISSGSVEVAHEALLREWPRLKGWIEDNRDGLRIHRRLTSAASEWDRVQRDDDALYRGTRLSEALDWQAAREPALNPLEREFLDASAARRQRERVSRRRRIELAFAGLAVALAAIAVVAIVAIHQRNDAKRERNLALSRALALQSEKEVDVDPELALRLAMWADDTAPTRDADAALRQAVLGYHQLAVLPTDSLAARTADYSPDGTRIVSGGDNGVVRIWDAASRREVAKLAAGHTGLLAARYAPDGRSIALGFADGALVMTDASLGSPRVVLRVHGQGVDSVAFSRDGSRLAAGFGDGTIRIVTPSGAGPVQVLRGHQGPVNGVDLSADARVLVSAGEDGSVRVWDTTGSTPQRTLLKGSRPETDVALSPDGRLIVGVGFDRQVRVWNARTGAQVRRIGGSRRELRSAAFSADGTRFAAGGGDGVTRVWSVAGGSPVAILRGQGGLVYDVAFGRTGQRLVSAGDDGNARIWDVEDGQLFADPGKVDNIDISRNGRLVVAGSEDGTVRIWDALTGKLRKSLPGPDGYTYARFTPAADAVIIGRDTTSSVILWPLASGSPRTIAKHPRGSGLYNVRLDASGRRVVYVDTRGSVTLTDIRSGRGITLGGAPKDLYDVQISPDGRHAVGGTESGRLIVWRLDQPTRPERVLTGHRGHINSATYGPGGRIVSASGDRTIRVWSPGGGPPVVLRGHDDDVMGAVFTRDGRHIISASGDGSVRLWDAGGGDALAVLASEDVALFDLAVSPRGTIATGDANSVVHVFPCTVCGDVAHVRALARSRNPRPLTDEERDRFLAAAR